jgi:hypothetical protein
MAPAEDPDVVDGGGPAQRQRLDVVELEMAGAAADLAIRELPLAPAAVAPPDLAADVGREVVGLRRPGFLARPLSPVASGRADLASSSLRTNRFETVTWSRGQCVSGFHAKSISRDLEPSWNARGRALARRRASGTRDEARSAITQRGRRRRRSGPRSRNGRAARFRLRRPCVKRELRSVGFARKAALDAAHGRLRRPVHPASSPTVKQPRTRRDAATSRFSRPAGEVMNPCPPRVSRATLAR